MIICVCSFSENGKEWEKVLKFQLPDVIWVTRPHDIKPYEWVKSQFAKRLPILFIGSVGIAVRIISPLVTDKFSDSPVMVMDEGGRNLIPILSGHIGGANELSRMIASKIGATPVITTSTDVHNVYSIDVFAQKNSLRIINRDAIKLVARKFISKKEIWLKIPRNFDLGDEIIPESIVIAYEDEQVTCDVQIVMTEGQADEVLKENPDMLILIPRKYCVGIGCKKGKTFEELNDFVKASLENLEGNYLDNIAAFASIDIKKNEIGIMNLAQFYHVCYKTFSKNELKITEAVDGQEFETSDFVKNVTGVDNVCERAAVACADEMGSCKNSPLTVKKLAKNGMTLAVAERIPKIVTWEC